MSKVKYPPDFCFFCGRTLETVEYLLDLGTPGSTFELCRSCLKRLHAKVGKALLVKGTPSNR